MTPPARLPRRAARLAAALRRDGSGVALMEFALTFPVLLLVGLVGIDVANFAIAHLRVSQIAMTTADNAARVRDSIDEHDINEVFIGARLVGASINFAERGRVILSDLEPRTVAPTTTGTSLNQWIRWQRCYGAKNSVSSYGTPRTAAGATISDGTETSATAPSDQIKSVPKIGAADSVTGMGPAGNQVAAGAGTAVMFVEVFYDYRPIFWNSLVGSSTIRYTAAFNVRQRNDQVMKSGGLASASWSTCNRFTST